MEHKGPLIAILKKLKDIYPSHVLSTMMGLEIRSCCLQVYFKGVISWRVFSRNLMCQEIIIILWLLHESIAFISSLGSLNSLICLIVVLFIIILFVFSCPFFPLFLLLR